MVGSIGDDTWSEILCCHAQIIILPTLKKTLTIELNIKTIAYKKL